MQVRICYWAKAGQSAPFQRWMVLFLVSLEKKDPDQLPSFTENKHNGSIVSTNSRGFTVTSKANATIERQKEEIGNIAGHFRSSCLSCNYPWTKLLTFSFQPSPDPHIPNVCT